MDDIDRDKVDQIVLALMYLTLHDSYRAWKGFEWRPSTGWMRMGGSRTREARQSLWY